MMLDHQNKTTGGHITYTHYHQNKTAGGHITTLIHIITRTRLQEDISLHLYTLSPEQDYRRTYRYTYTHYHQNKTTGGHITYTHYPDSNQTSLCYYTLLRKNNTIFILFNLEPTIYCTGGQHACHYSNDVISSYMYI